MPSTQRNTDLNSKLWDFSVQRGSLERAINNNQREEILKITARMRWLLVSVRSAVREHMPDDTKQ